MARKQRRFQRPLGNRRYKKLFVLAVEGIKTEPRYFDLFNHRDAIIHVRCLKTKQGNSAPTQVLKRMKDHLKQEGLKRYDEAWLVVDKDAWKDEQLDQLYQWALEDHRYGFALSNPKFEYWLLLHFEDGDDISSAQECTKRIKRHIPDYNKDIHAGKFTPQAIADAIKRGKQRDNPPCADWPRKLGTTTVYKLVENLGKGWV